MHTEVISALFAMLRNQLDGTALPFAKLPAERLEAVIKLAEHHQISQLIGACVIANNLSEDSGLLAQCRREKISIGLQLQAQNAEARRIYAVLSQHNIPYIPLKGQVVRGLYPQPWMRNSRDVDILLPAQLTEEACRLLCQSCGYTVLSDGGHDITLRAANGLWMEMHYRLLEDDEVPYLDSVWDRATPVGNGTEHRMCQEDFYLYHLAHMAKHVRIGGCGIRPLMDLWLFMKQAYRTSQLDELLRQNRLLRFAEAMEQLCRVWFGGEEHSDSTRRIEAFLLRGGVHGDEQFYHLDTLYKRRGKFRYFLSGVFPPFAKLKEQYPLLQRHPYLAPVMAVRRLGRILFGRDKTSYRTQLQHIQGISKAASKEINAMWKDVGF